MRRVAIVGAGPAGLTLAKLLASSPDIQPVLFEAKDRIGGKSETLYEGGVLIEMGTCYTTTAYKQLHKWMQACGITLRAMKRQLFDDGTFEDYVNRGPGAPTAIQGIRYVLARNRLMKQLEERPNDPSVLAEASMIAEDWLDQQNLPKIKLLFHRTYVNLGYGFLDETTISQVMRWTDFDLIWSGLRKKLKMPVEGWSEFWNRFAADLDIRLSSPVERIDRSEDSVSLTYKGTSESFDAVVCAIPLDDFANLTPPTENETFILNGTEWSGYTTTLLSASNWFTDVDTHSFSSGLISGAQKGQLISARREGYSSDLGGDLYISGQITGDLSAEELAETLKSDVEAKGATFNGILHQRLWKYHNHQKPEAILNGLLSRMKHMQGEHSTFYTGTTFSHEAVSHIVRHNLQLARDMQTRLLTS